MATDVRLADWTFISGAIAVAETRLLSDDEFLDLLRLPSLEALLGRIKQVETYVHLAPPESPDDAAATLEREFINIVRRVEQDAPDAAVCELMLVNTLFAELRSFVRERLADEEPGEQSSGFFADGALEALWNDSFEARPDLRETVSKLRTTLEKSEDAAAIADLLLDREEIVRFLSLARSVGSEFADDWSALAARLHAALVVIRARLAGTDVERLTDMFLGPPLDDEWLLALAAEDLERLDGVLAQGFTPPEGETPEVSRAAVGKLSRMMDDRLTLEMTPARMIAFGPERLLGYLWGLHIENLNLRLIAETLVVEGDRDETRARLRRSYV